MYLHTARTSAGSTATLDYARDPLDVRAIGGLAFNELLLGEGFATGHAVSQSEHARGSARHRAS